MLRRQMMRRGVRRSLFSACILFFTLVATVPAQVAAQVVKDLPQLEGVGLDEHVGNVVPTDLEFADESGRIVKMGDLMRGKPTVLVLGYYGCPMLCGLVLNGFLDAAKLMPWTVGREYDVVYVSIDPSEQPPLAAGKKESTLRSYGRPGAETGWHFLTGTQAATSTLAASIGFRYRYVESRKEWAHPSVITLVGSDGRISRYLYGIQYDPRTVRLGLTEAGQGKTGSTMDQFLLYCFHYDENEGRYVIAAQNVMRAGGAITLAVLSVWLIPIWWRAARRRTGQKGNVA